MPVHVQRPPSVKRLIRRAVGVALMLSTLLAAPHAQSTSSEEAERVADATAVFGEIMAADDKSIPASILEKAQGIAVFPSTLHGAFIVGGMRGRGVLSVRGTDGQWSAPAFLTLTGGSLGFQIGGQATDLILVVSNRRGVENLVRNQFKLGANASVAAGPVGRDTQAATDLEMRAQILSYSRARGVFAGVSVNGTTVRTDRDANQRFYGKRLETREIVFDGLGGSPAGVDAWRGVLSKYAR